MTWKERLIGLPLAFLGALLLSATLASMAATGTQKGREELRSFLLEKANSLIAGRIEVDALVAGDLFRNLKLAGVRIYQPDGNLFALVDTLDLRYRWSDFLFGNVTFPRAKLVRPIVELRRHPSGSWNFDEVFAAKSPSEDPKQEGTVGVQRRIVLRDVRVHDGDVTLRLPWTAEDTAFRPDESRWNLVNNDGHWYRLINLKRLNANFPIARVVGPASLGRLLIVADLSGTLSVMREPIEIDQLRADVEQHGDTIAFDLWEADLPASHVFGAGWVTLSSPNRFDFTLSGNPVRTGDLRWLLGDLLPKGQATLDYTMRSTPSGVSYSARDAQWTSEEADLRGDFAISFSANPGRERIAFDAVDLDVRHFSTSLLQRFTDWRPPAEGDLSGRVALDGSLSELDLDLALEFKPVGGGTVSRVSARGQARAVPDDPGGSNLLVEFEPLHSDLVRSFFPGYGIPADLEGTIEIDGALSDRVNVTAELAGQPPGRRRMALRGEGVLRERDGATHVDLSAFADPVSLTTLAEYYTWIPFRGEFRGELAARGPLSSLDLRARLGGIGDSLVFDGHVTRDAGTLSYAGALRGRSAEIAEFREGIGASILDFSLDFDGQGTDTRAMIAQGRVDLSSSFVGGLRFDSAFADLRVDHGLLLVDSAHVVTEIGLFSASGALGLHAGTEDSLAFSLVADSLGRVNRWLAPEADPFAQPLEAQSAEKNGALRRLSGAAVATGHLVGNLDSLVVRSQVRGEKVAYGRWSADSLEAENLEVEGVGGVLRLGGFVRAHGAGTGGARFEGLTLSGGLVDSVAAFDFKLSGHGGGALAGRVRAEFRGETRTVELQSFTALLGESSTWRLAAPARLELVGDRRVSLSRLELESGDGLLEAEGVLAESGPAAFGVRVEGLDVGDLATLHDVAEGISGVVKFNGRVSGTAADPSVSADLLVEDGEAFGVSFSALEGALDYERGAAGVEMQMTLRGQPLLTFSGTLPVSLALPKLAPSFPNRPVSLRLEGDSIPLNLAALLTGEVLFSAGFARAGLDIGGTFDEPELSGQLTVVNGTGFVNPAGITYHAVSGSASLSGKSIEIERLDLAGGTGSGRISGIIDLTEWGNPRFGLDLEAFELPVYDRSEGAMVVSGPARLTGPYDGAMLAGNVSVVRGVLYMEEIGRRREIVDPYGEGLLLLDTVFTADNPLQLLRRNPFIHNLTIELNLNVERDTWLRSEETNVEIAGRVSLTHNRAEEAFRMSGMLQALRGDHLLLKAKRFAIEEGQIEFVGVPALNPNIRLVAKHRVQTQKRPLEIRVLITGTLEEPTVRLESDAQPPIPEEDLLSYVLFGRPTYEITRASGEEGSVVDDVTSRVPEAFLGYALESLLVGETGIAYVDVSRAPVKGYEGLYSSSTAPVLAATQVEVGWYLAPTVFVSVAQHLSTVINLPTVQVEWRLNNRLTVRGIAEPRLARGTTVLAQNPAADLTEAIGLFLFYGWSY